MGDVQTIAAILDGAAAYAALGAVFALVFLAFGLGRVDHGARGAGLLFRLVIVPGLIALWPLMLVRWVAGGQPHGD